MSDSASESSMLFQSTPSARRATYHLSAAPAVYPISIHALREEGDIADGGGDGIGVSDFNPRPPRGGRLVRLIRFLDENRISIHALREEGDG